MLIFHFYSSQNNKLIDSDLRPVETDFYESDPTLVNCHQTYICSWVAFQLHVAVVSATMKLVWIASRKMLKVCRWSNHGIFFFRIIGLATK